MKFRFLDSYDAYDVYALSVMKKCGPEVAPTDLAALLGAHTYKGDLTSEGEVACVSWLSDCNPWQDIYGISNCRRALPTALSQYRRDIGARPVLDPSEVSKISLKEKGFINGCRVVEWGEYPQSITDEYTNKRLEELYSSSSLCSTGKNYTFDGVHPWQIAPPFEAESYPEYKLDDKRYIRIIPKGVTGGAGVFPTTGERFEKKPYWVQVEPVEWLMDDPTGIMVAKKCLFAGIQFNPEKIYRADLSTSFMQVYLDNYFSKEIEPKEPERTKELSKDFDAATLRRAKLRSGR